MCLKNLEKIKEKENSSGKKNFAPVKKILGVPRGAKEKNFYTKTGFFFKIEKKTKMVLGNNLNLPFDFGLVAKLKFPGEKVAGVFFPEVVPCPPPPLRKLKLGWGQSKKTVPGVVNLIPKTNKKKTIFVLKSQKGPKRLWGYAPDPIICQKRNKSGLFFLEKYYPKKKISPFLKKQGVP